ncbi:hypothetical protein [Halopiger xanaduensis]|uniref:Uncharacterized protein n=1 Tax=Halopiger xanaduensis (strain DSM 18323 / JCM 14033 / SH-6) TaxID=797210 RepID=F8DCS1_HALXS|nr:hypothetical protein [Halopiger xanaduensis]AEH37245.1 hypothetical protein Halxa_2627 [Halopiger xanaduensis SH-6]
MTRPSPTTVAIAALGGLANVAVVLGLYARGDYPAPEVAVLAVTAFLVGFLPWFATAYTRLLTPAIGFLAALSGTAYLEFATPPPEWGQLGEYVVVDGPTHVSSYANAWDVWLALLTVAGVLEFAIRRGYGIGGDRLRNLPTLPFSRDRLVRTVGSVAALVGLAATLLVLRAGIRPPAAAAVVFLFAAAVTAVPLAALLARGIVVPTVLFALVPYTLVYEVFVTTDSPLHILLFGPYAIVLALAWVLEEAIRSRLGGWDGGRFAGREPA